MKSLNHGTRKRLYVSIAIVCSSLIAIAGTAWVGGTLAAGNGAPPGTAGVPYDNMPAIAPTGVRMDKYFDVLDFAKGPATDPAKGCRTQMLGDVCAVHAAVIRELRKSSQIPSQLSVSFPSASRSNGVT